MMVTRSLVLLALTGLISSAPVEEKEGRAGRAYGSATAVGSVGGATALASASTSSGASPPVKYGANYADLAALGGTLITRGASATAAASAGGLYGRNGGFAGASARAAASAGGYYGRNGGFGGASARAAASAGGYYGRKRRDTDNTRAYGSATATGSVGGVNVLASASTNSNLPYASSQPKVSATASVAPGAATATAEGGHGAATDFF